MADDRRKMELSWQRPMTHTVMDNDGLERIRQSGVTWVIGARGGLQFCRPEKLLDAWYLAIDVHRRAQGNKIFTTAMLMITLLFPSKQKSTNRYLTRVTTILEIPISLPFCRPSWLPPRTIRRFRHWYESLRWRQRRIHISDGVDKFTWFGWKKRWFHLDRQQQQQQ